MSNALSAFLLTISGLLPIVNPLESAPFFLGLTSHLQQSERAALALKIAFNGTMLLLGSMVLGPWLLVIFGIDLPVVRIAGGLVITALGWKLLNQEHWSDHDASGVSAQDGRVGTFYPLTMPLTVGPGSMSVAIAIGSREPSTKWHIGQLAFHGVGALAGLLVVGLSIYVAYRGASQIARVLGATGLEVLVRLSAFILMCIGIEFIWNGYSELTAH
jgi:multiple antibiotic resistance protein